MVRTATHWPSERSHPDPIRIAAISISIALNIAALGLLMRPPEFTPPTARTETTPVVFIPPAEKKKVILPIAPAKHERKQTTPVVAKTDQKPQTVILPTTPMSTDPIQPLTIDKGDKVDITPPTAEASLTPIDAPAPVYPRDALRDEITGTVELELLVGVDGSVVEVRVIHSSGNRQLDNAAREQVLRKWRFQPATRDGIPVQAWGRVPVVFKLDGR
jgi:protein TonB